MHLLKILIEEENERRNDAIDLIVDGMSEEQIFFNEETGQDERKTVRNSKIAWYKGHIINQPFGRYALFLERLESFADDAPLFMFEKRAREVARQIRAIVAQYRRSIDAKSSETYKDKDNTQSALIHVLSKNKVEKQYTFEGDGAKGSFMSGLFNRGDRD